MKLFLSYRYTGEDLTILKQIVESICQSLEKAGHSTFCSFGHNDFFKENNYSYKQILEYAFNELDASDYVIAFVKSQDKSEGMFLELGYALAKGKKIILLIKEGVKTVFLPEIAHHVIEFADLNELYSNLEELRLK